MAMSPLQLGLIGAGIVLVVGVIIYNWWQERRVRQRIESAFRPSETQKPTPGPDTARVEPSRRHEAERGVERMRTRTIRGRTANR